MLIPIIAINSSVTNNNDNLLFVFVISFYVIINISVFIHTLTDENKTFHEVIKLSEIPIIVHVSLILNV